MKLSLFSAAAFAAVITGAPVHSNGHVHATEATHDAPVPVTAPTLSPRYAGDCHLWCKYHPTYCNPYMSRCAKRTGPDTNIESLSDSKVDDNDFGKVAAAGKLEARNDDSILDGNEMLDVHFGTLMGSIQTYGAIYTRINGIHNTVQRPDFPMPQGKWVDEYLAAWLQGYKNTLERADSPESWLDDLYEHVAHSQDATAQLYARRFELVARKDVWHEMKDMIEDLPEDQQLTITASVRMAWREAFALPAWGV